MADFAANHFALASGSLAEARAYAGELQIELQKSATHFSKQSEKVAGMKVPFISKAVGGDRKKGEKYHSLAESLTQLVGQAKALHKP